MKRQMGALGGARLASAAAQAVSLIILVQSMPVADFGRFGAIFSVLSVVFAIAALGLVPFVLREHAKGNYDGVVSAIKCNALTSGLALLLSSITLFWGLDTKSLFFPYALLAVVFALDKNIEVRLAISVALSEIRVPAISIAIRSLCGLATLIILLALGVQPLYAYVVGRLVATVMALAHVHICVRVPDGEWMGARALGAKLWPLATSNVIGATRSLDTMVVTAVAGLTVAGLYSAAVRTLGPVSVVAGALSSVLLPHSVRTELAELNRLVNRLVAISAAATVLAVPFALYSAQFVELLFGVRYEMAAGAFGWILVGLPVSAVSPMLATVLQGRGKERAVAYNSAVFTGVTLLGVALGALTHGATGAAIALTLLTWMRYSSLYIIYRTLR